MPKSKRSKHSRRRKQSPLRSLLYEYTLEFAAVGLVILGLFLLLGQGAKSNFAIRFLRGIGRLLSSFFEDFRQALQMRGLNVSPSDGLGILFFITAVVLIGIRIRTRFIERYHVLTTCAECGGSELTRESRNSFERALSFVFQLKIRKYTCRTCKHPNYKIVAEKAPKAP